MGENRPNRKLQLVQFFAVAVCIFLMMSNLKAASSKECVELEPEVLASLRGGEGGFDQCCDYDVWCSMPGLEICTAQGLFCFTEDCEGFYSPDFRAECKTDVDPEHFCSWYEDLDWWERCCERYCKLVTYNVCSCAGRKTTEDEWCELHGDTCTGHGCP